MGKIDNVIPCDQGKAHFSCTEESSGILSSWDFWVHFFFHPSIISMTVVKCSLQTPSFLISYPHIASLSSLFNSYRLTVRRQWNKNLFLCNSRLSSNMWTFLRSDLRIKLIGVQSHTVFFPVLLPHNNRDTWNSPLNKFRHHSEAWGEKMYEIGQKWFSQKW